MPNQNRIDTIIGYIKEAIVERLKFDPGASEQVIINEVLIETVSIVIARVEELEVVVRHNTGDKR